MAFDFRVRTAAEFVERFGNEGEVWTATLYPTREAWLEGRKGHLGASDAYKVLDGELRDKLFDELSGKRPHEDLSDNEFVARGIEAEPHVRALIAIENPDWEIFDGSNLLFVSKVHPWMSATLDCIAVNRITGEWAIVELKEAPWSKKWKSEYAPDGYFCQLMHQSVVTGIVRTSLHPRIYFRREDGFTTSSERSYDYYTDDEAVAGQVADLIEKEREFWDDLKRGVRKPVLSIESIF